MTDEKWFLVSSVKLTERQEMIAEYWEFSQGRSTNFILGINSPNLSLNTIRTNSMTRSAVFRGQQCPLRYEHRGMGRNAVLGFGTAGDGGPPRRLACFTATYSVMADKAEDR